MTNLSQFFESWEDKSDYKKIKTYNHLYHTNKISVPEMAKARGTNANKVLREMKKLGIPIRPKSERTKIALDNGRKQHPTKGKHRTEEEKRKIGESIGQAWDKKTAEEKQVIIDKHKAAFEKRTDKEELYQKRDKARLATRKTGSKLESYIRQKILEDFNTRVIYHELVEIAGEKMHIDIYVPEYKIVIEIDGPSHNRPIFGEDKLAKVQLSDQKKNSLFLSFGFYVMRVRQDAQKLTERRKRHLWSKVKNALDDIKANRLNHTAANQFILVE